MSVIQVGLIDKTGKLDPQLVESTAAALNIQVIRDLAPAWNVQGTVRHLPDPNSIPQGVWPVFLVDQLPPGEGGVHLDDNNQPYSLVLSTPATANWTIDASHETLEMLVDPGGNRLQASRAIEIAGNGVEDTPDQFEYLVEACDPCQANDCAYVIDGIAVSDFITPHYYDPVANDGTRYSFAGNIKAPRQLLAGGYISFVNPQSNEVEQIVYLGQKPELRNLGSANGLSLRAFVDGKTNALVAQSRKPNQELTDWCDQHRKKIREAAVKRAGSYRFST